MGLCGFPKDRLSIIDIGGVRCKTENKSVNQDINSPKVYRQLNQRDKTIRVLGRW